MLTSAAVLLGVFVLGWVSGAVAARNPSRKILIRRLLDTKAQLVAERGVSARRAHALDRALAREAERNARGG